MLIWICQSVNCQDSVAQTQLLKLNCSSYLACPLKNSQKKTLLALETRLIRPIKLSQPTLNLGCETFQPVRVSQPTRVDMSSSKPESPPARSQQSEHSKFAQKRRSTTIGFLGNSIYWIRADVIEFRLSQSIFHDARIRAVSFSQRSATHVECKMLAIYDWKHLCKRHELRHTPRPHGSRQTLASLRSLSSLRLNVVSSSGQVHVLVVNLALELRQRRQHVFRSRRRRGRDENSMTHDWWHFFVVMGRPHFEEETYVVERSWHALIALPRSRDLDLVTQVSWSSST